LDRRIQDAGDAALKVVFGETLDPSVNDAVLDMAEAIRREQRPGVLSVISGYTTVLVEYDPDVVTRATLVSWLDCLKPQAAARVSRLIEVPVCYGGELGPDLEDVAGRVGTDPGQVVRLHTSVTYRVYATGFAPGFPFAAPLAPQLVLPRRDSPRDRVPAGSVAIAGRQTGIYSLPTPGGWHILGRTPLPLFRPDTSDPIWLHPGDRIRFAEISPGDFQRLQQEGRDEA
jgi:inhibitor of KinA